MCIKIGIIGMPDSGKTTFAEYLANRKLPEKKIKSFSTKTYENIILGNDEELYGREVCITDCRSRSRPDLGKYDYEQEKEIINNCDIILYFFDVSKFFGNERDSYFKKVAKQRKITLQSFFGHKIIFGVGTFWDKLDEIENEIGEEEFLLRSAHYEEFVDKSMGFAIYASFINKDNAEKTLSRIIETIENTSKDENFDIEFRYKFRPSNKVLNHFCKNREMLKKEVCKVFTPEAAIKFIAKLENIKGD